MNGLLLLPGWEGTSQHELADWLMTNNTFEPPSAGQGLNVSLASAAVHARQLGLTDTSALTELLTYLSVSAGRDPDIAKTEAARAAIRSATGFTGTTPKAPRHDPLIIKANARALLKGLPSWTSPQPIPDTPHGQLAAVLDWYDPSDLISVQTSTTAGRLYTVAELLVDGPPAPGPKGVYWRANPVSQASGYNHTCTDDDVTKHEWLLIESDCLPLDQQIPLLLSTGLRPAHIVDSGKKSMQASIRVNATSKEEFAALAALVLHNLAAIGFDPVTTNTSRLRRMPGAIRPDGRDGEHTLQRLVYLDPAAPTLTPEAAHTIVSATKAKLHASALLWVRDIHRDPSSEPIDFVEGLLTAGALSVIYGDSNVGKSFFMLDLAAAVATGKVWRDLVDPRQTDPTPVLYIALEGALGIQNRIIALKESNKLDPDAPFALMMTPVNLQAPESAVDVLQKVAEFTRRVGKPPGLIILDTLSRAFGGGNENDSKDMTLAVRHIDMIRTRAPAHFAVIHHCGKDQAKGARGHSSLRAATDTEIELFRPEDSKIITAVVKKQRDLTPCPPMPFELEIVAMYKNRRGQDVTTCVVKHLPAAEAGTRDAIDDRKRQAQTSEDVASYHEALAVLPQPSVRAWSKAIGWSNSTLQRLIERMAKKGCSRHVVDPGSGQISSSLNSIPDVE